LAYADRNKNKNMPNIYFRPVPHRLHIIIIIITIISKTMFMALSS